MLVVGGRATDYTNIVDAYDDVLTRTIQVPISSIRSSISGTAIGKYGLLGGGRDEYGGVNIVEVYSAE